MAIAQNARKTLRNSSKNGLVLSGSSRTRPDTILLPNWNINRLDYGEVQQTELLYQFNEDRFKRKRGAERLDLKSCSEKWVPRTRLTSFKKSCDIGAFTGVHSSWLLNIFGVPSCISLQMWRRLEIIATAHLYCEILLLPFTSAP